MATLTNTSTGDLVLPNGLFVPARGSVEVEASVAHEAKKSTHPVVKGWFESGALTTDAPEEALQEAPKGTGGNVESPVDVTTLNDEELRAFLTKHDAKVDNRWSRDRLLSEAQKIKPAA